MDIMGYQAVTVEMVQRVRKACQVHLDHVVFKGEAGEKGVAGPPGPRGIKGEAGPVGKVAAEQRNWKQCAWKKEDGKDIGLIKVSATMNETSKFRKREKITNFFFRVGVTGQ